MKNQIVEIEEFIELAKQFIVIDVRTPAEFAQGHIHNAINIPIFSNDERAQIGILYKNSGRKTAIKKGLDIVGPKLSTLLKKAEQHLVDNTILIHCWRGGMRSSSVAWLLNTYGIETYTLYKGYKAYRNYVLDSFKEKYNMLVLGGMTGSGKTKILYDLQSLGEQIIDIEKLAHHKGSSFGAIGMNEQPRTEQFENDLFSEIQKIDNTKYFWVEDESRMTGKVRIPNAFYDQMREARVIKINVPKELRIKQLIEDYTGVDDKLLEEALYRIEKRLGGLALKNALQALKDKNYEEVASISLEYYDKAYNYGLSIRKPDTVKELSINSPSSLENAKLILKFVKELD